MRKLVIVRRGSWQLLCKVKMGRRKTSFFMGTPIWNRSSNGLIFKRRRCNAEIVHNGLACTAKRNRSSSGGPAAAPTGWTIRFSPATADQVDDQSKVAPYEGKNVKLTGTVDTKTNTLHVVDVAPAGK